MTDDPDTVLDVDQTGEEPPDPDPLEQDTTQPPVTPMVAGFSIEGAATMAEPTPDTELGFSYEYGIDIYIPPTGGTGEGTWQPVRFASAINPTVTFKEEDGATYDDLGADHPIRTGETPQLDFYAQQHRLEDGKFMPEIEVLLAATRPDALGNKGVVKARYYDKPVSGTPNADEAYELTATVSSFARANTANSGLGGWNFTLKGQGPRRKITNPATTAPTP